MKHYNLFDLKLFRIKISQIRISSISASFRDKLNEYKREFNVRSVILFSNPNADVALNPIGDNWGGTSEEAYAYFELDNG